MARYVGPKCRLCRRIGERLMLKGERCATPKCPLEEGASPPGQRFTRRRKLSDYSLRLQEKQKAKHIYGILEQQFHRFFTQAKKAPGKTGETLLQLLERRLDNVVYRLGFAKTLSQARQLVNHGHVIVDDKKVDIPSYNIKVGQFITLNAKALDIPFVQESLKETKPANIPAWLERKGPVGKVKRLPEKEDLRTDIDISLIVEYYSR